MNQILETIIEDVLTSDFEYFTPSEIEEEVEYTRLRRVSSEFSRIGGVRNF